ncbi:MAG TPA: hypothetical protein VHB73_01550 [Alphaproteobacteria bacterium]|nr:hypothetical protein [Alphaproteobacteria bacterium]
MSRDISELVAATVAQRNFPAVILAELEFDAGTIRLWSGSGTLTWNGNDYSGVGGLCGISQYNETEDLSAQGLSLQLTGIPESYISLALGQNYRRRPCRIYLGFRPQDEYLVDELGNYAVDENGNYALAARGDLFSVVDSPYLWFEGLMNVMKIQRSRGTATITVQADNEMVLLKQIKVQRLTPESQKAIYPGDTFFDLLAANQDKVFPWGSSPAK